MGKKHLSKMLECDGPVWYKDNMISIPGERVRERGGVENRDR